MILPAKGQRTTEFFVAICGVLVLAFGVWKGLNAEVYAGAAVISSYALSRGIAKAGFGRAAHETRGGV